MKIFENFGKLSNFELFLQVEKIEAFRDYCNPSVHRFEKKIENSTHITVYLRILKSFPEKFNSISLRYSIKTVSPSFFYLPLLIGTPNPNENELTDPE